MFLSNTANITSVLWGAIKTTAQEQGTQDAPGIKPEPMQSEQDTTQMNAAWV